MKFNEVLNGLVDAIANKIALIDSTSVKVPNVLISTINIEQGAADSLIQVTGDIAIQNADGDIVYTSISDSGNYGIPAHASANENVFSWIRENTKKVHGSWNKELGLFKYINVEDSDFTDSELFKTNGVFIILPAFYWKCENIDANHSTVSVAKDFPGPSWNYYDGKYAIPCYKVSGFADINSSAIKKTTIGEGVELGEAILDGDDGNISSGSKVPAQFISQQAGVALAKTLGTNWSLINYEIHKIITLLCLGYYGRIDIRNYIGKAGDNENKYHYTQAISDFDTVISDTLADGSADSTCVWGLVDWYNNEYEWVDDILCLGAINEFEQDEDGVCWGETAMGIIDNELKYDLESSEWVISKKVKRVITCGTTDEYIGSNAILGLEFDLMPSKNSLYPNTDENDNVMGWSCSFFSDAGSGNVAYRACGHCGSGAGLALLGVGSSASHADGSFGLRLLYHGEMVEVDVNHFSE